MLVALALAVMLWSVYWLSRTFEARAQEQLQTQQALEADLWARMLSARLEASQRLLSAIAQGMHTSLLDKPEILDALMRQEGSVLSLFESLHVALPSGVVSQHSLAAQSAALGPDGLSALRRTMAEGKPTVSAMPYQQEEPQYLYVLLTVPIRQVDGQVSAALAAMVKYPVALLLPDVLTQPEASQYYLLDRTGVVLAHADSTQRGSSIQQAWPDRQLVQRLLEQPAITLKTCRPQRSCSPVWACRCPSGRWCCSVMQHPRCLHGGRVCRGRAGCGCWAARWGWPG